MRKHCSGFTLIEMVIAIALSAMMITIISSVTRSGAEAARKQQLTSNSRARRSAIEQLMRNDLSGWLVSPSASVALSQSTENELSRVSFMTSNDAIGSSENVTRHVYVSYVVRSSLGQYELDRIEKGRGNSNTLSLLTSTQLISLELFDGTKWMTKWLRSDRPDALRITVDGITWTIRL
jgi:prepilin-type N-terminal cleavage/methylation domain-containing protein